ncbi:MAG: HAMP domain-containing sensor histidine kinase [Clostridium sp.]|uniref:sensor histidine kinase n=1 Tax=Clostridium sp. TaxID=1506 RepID=UPI002FC9AD6B
MTKFKSKSIKTKVFIVTSIALFLSAFLIYLVVYAVLPGYYSKYKRSSIDEGVTNLVNRASKLTFNEAKGLIDEFATRNNVSISVHDSLGRVLYVPSVYLSITDENNKTNYVIVPDQFQGSNGIEGFPYTQFATGFYTASSKIKFSDMAFPLSITVRAALQPIDEASKVILNLMPYILILILGVAGFGAYIYVKLLADPLIAINKTAKKMAKLDFETKCSVDSEDELGEIANALNELSTNLKKTMDELESSNKKLKSDIEKEREMEVKRREFISTISHELKSPIAAVKGQIEGMIQNIGVFKDRERYLRRSYSIINDMEKLVIEILDMSKLETYNFKPKVENINLSSMVKEIVYNEEYLLFSKSLNVIDNIEQGLNITGDYNLIKKAVANIINNAIKYSPEKEKVFIDLVKVEDGIEFKVRNTGVTIENKDLEEIFKPFYRVEKSRSRSTGGSGLGLYIVKNILDNHGYKYSLMSNNNSVEFKVVFHL